MPSRRHRVIVQKPGGYDVLKLDETPIEDPRPDEIQVQVKACGVNFADVSVRLGLYGAAKGDYPVCPGLEFAGVMGKVGAAIERFRPGDRVFGATRFGGYATVINSPQEHLWNLPDDWDFDRGAAFPVAYLTAFYALHEVGNLKEPDRVLIHSAAGGVGTALLHLLKINGNLSVGAVGGTHKAETALSAGAAHVIDKQRQNLWREAERLSPAGYDLILDANGASTLRGSYGHLAPGGRLLVYGFASMFSPSGRRNWAKLIWYYFRTPRFSPFDLTSTNKTISGFNLIYLFDRVALFREIMEKLLGWDQEGLIPPTPISRFPFQEAGKAHRVMESGQTVGKLVLVT